MGHILVACEEIVSVIGAAREARARQHMQGTTTDSATPVGTQICGRIEAGATAAYQNHGTNRSFASACYSRVACAADSVGADDLLPALIYVVIHAAPRQLHSNTAYILQVMCPHVS